MQAMYLPLFGAWAPIFGALNDRLIQTAVLFLERVIKTSYKSVHINSMKPASSPFCRATRTQLGNGSTHAPKFTILDNG